MDQGNLLTDIVNWSGHSTYNIYTVGRVHLDLLGTYLGLLEGYSYGNIFSLFQLKKLFKNNVGHIWFPFRR